LVVLVGQRKAIAIAVRNVSGRRRRTRLLECLGNATASEQPYMDKGNCGPSDFLVNACGIGENLPRMTRKPDGSWLAIRNAKLPLCHDPSGAEIMFSGRFVPSIGTKLPMDMKGGRLLDLLQEPPRPGRRGED
jgi:hypothetical protein